MFWYWVAEISTFSMLGIYTPSYSSAFNKLTGELSELREVFTDIIFKGSCPNSVSKGALDREKMVTKTKKQSVT